MPKIANVRPRDLIRLLHRMRFDREDRDHANFCHEWLNLWTKISHGDKEIDADLMGRISNQTAQDEQRRRVPRGFAWGYSAPVFGP